MENEEDTSSVILNQTGPIQTETSDLKGENLGSLPLSKMNAKEFKSDVEQDAVKQKSLLDVGQNKLSGSDNSVNPQPNSQPKIDILEATTNNLNLFLSRTSSLTQVTSATNLTSLKSHAHVNGAARSSSSSHLESVKKDIAAFSINSPKSSNLFNKVTFLLLFFYFSVIQC
jgi:hypothetical protein